MAKINLDEMEDIQNRWQNFLTDIEPIAITYAKLKGLSKVDYITIDIDDEHYLPIKDGIVVVWLHHERFDDTTIIRLTQEYLDANHDRRLNIVAQELEDERLAREEKTRQIEKNKKRRAEERKSEQITKAIELLNRNGYDIRHVYDGSSAVRKSINEI